MTTKQPPAMAGEGETKTKRVDYTSTSVDLQQHDAPDVPDVRDVPDVPSPDRYALNNVPDCFSEHNAPLAVRVLFREWVKRADQTGNGGIAINRRRQVYSSTTVSRAIRWLTAHRLIMRVEHGGGRGVGSRFLIRWSFVYPNPSARQKAANLREYANTGNFPYTHLRKRYAPPEIHSEIRKSSQKKKSSEKELKAKAFGLPQLRQKIQQLKDEKLPSQRDKRVLMAAVRKLVNAPKPVADGVCSQIARQRNRTCGEWKRVLRLMWHGCELGGWTGLDGVKRDLGAEIPNARLNPRLFSSYWARVVKFAARGYALGPADELFDFRDAMIAGLRRETTVAEDLRYVRARLRGFSRWKRENADIDPPDAWFRLRAAYDELSGAMEEGLGNELSWKILESDFR